MIRSFRVASRAPLTESVRTKVISAPGLLKQSERLKRWHKDNKELFGPLIETNKEKKHNLLNKTAKNSRIPKNIVQSNRNSETNNTSEVNVVNLNRKSVDSLANKRQFTSHIQLYSKMSSMWTRSASQFIRSANKSNCNLDLLGIVVRNSSSLATAGYQSEDKILQIKPHKHDYSKEYPSVTLILNKTMSEDSKAVLEKWKQEKIAEMGLEEFNKYYEAQMAVGTKFHETLKHYFTQPRRSLVLDTSVEGVWNSVQDVLQKVSQPKAIESNVVHPTLKYRGIFDAIADYEDRPTLIEWKKSDKPRKAVSATYDNPVQLAAYFGAVANDLNYKHLKVRDALLVIAYTDGSRADAYPFRAEQLREHWAAWLARLERYLALAAGPGGGGAGAGAGGRLPGGKRLFDEDIANLD